MSETSNEIQASITRMAERTIQHYVRGLLSVNELVVQLLPVSEDQEEARMRVLERQARGICSQALCEACLSSDPNICDLGFENLGRYLQEKLAKSIDFYQPQREDIIAEVVQQTLLVIVDIMRRNGRGPDRPVAFLKWAQVILSRQHALYRQASSYTCLSLEAEQEAVYGEGLLDKGAIDPCDVILRQEIREILQKAITILKNPHYRQVLLSTYLSEIEEHELAERWQVQVQDIYLWRYRALKMLRKNSQMVQALQYLA
jgi:DNA-directed RNA polymerase specialized sigma24 family protein